MKIKKARTRMGIFDGVNLDIRKKPAEGEVEPEPVQEVSFTDLVNKAKDSLPEDLRVRFMDELSSEVNQSVERALASTTKAEGDRERYIRALRTCWINRDERIFDDQKASNLDIRWDSGRFGLSWHVCLNKGMLD